MFRKRPFYIILIILLAFILIKVFDGDQKNEAGTQSYRDVTNLVLTKHAKCRMDCRQISLKEIKEIIENGRLNRSKSGRGSQGDRTYALDGYSHENQHIRVVVATEENSLVVITCIDLNVEWPCHCD